MERKNHNLFCNIECVTCNPLVYRVRQKEPVRSKIPYTACTKSIGMNQTLVESQTLKYFFDLSPIFLRSLNLCKNLFTSKFSEKWPNSLDKIRRNLLT